MTTPHSSLHELSYEECLWLLRSATVGRVAVMCDEFPVVLPVNYRLVEASERTWIAFRTRLGSTLDRAPMRAAFEIDGVDRKRHDGWSVLVRGTLHHVDPDAAGFRERFEPDTWLPDRDSWLVLEPFAVTGRGLHGPEPDWAFEVRAYL